MKELCDIFVVVPLDDDDDAVDEVAGLPPLTFDCPPNPNAPLVLEESPLALWGALKGGSTLALADFKEPSESETLLASVRGARVKWLLEFTCPRREAESDFDILEESSDEDDLL